jgi:apolipoprotein N-acyltransferase
MGLSFGRWGAAVLSGALIALGTGLHPFPLALWVAPAPLLIAAFSASRLETWVLGLVAGVISMTGVAGYYLVVAPPPVVIAIVILTSVLLAGMTAITAGWVRRSDHWLLPFVFPVLAAGFEMVISAISPHSTAGSWAYSQMDWPVALQVAALGGETAIVFVLALASSTIAVAIFKRGRIKAPVIAYGLPVVLIATALGWGWQRIESAPPAPLVHVGLVAIDAKPDMPDGTGGPDDARLSAYLDAANSLAGHGAKIVVIPEKIENLDDAGALRARAGASIAALSARTPIVLGLSLHLKDSWRNAAWMFDASGRQIVDYDKRHMVPGFESKYRVGSKDAIVAIDGVKYGVAICKDMDFPALGRGYAGVNAMLVPAWDFHVDGWLHGRMAMLRSVENGYALVRAARNGRLTVNDRFGRVVADRRSNAAPVSRLLADAPLGPGEPTLYDRGGWLFGWVCAGLGLLLILTQWFVKPRKAAS